MTPFRVGDDARHRHPLLAVLYSVGGINAAVATLGTLIWR